MFSMRVIIMQYQSVSPARSGFFWLVAALCLLAIGCDTSAKQGDQGQSGDATGTDEPPFLAEPAGEPDGEHGRQFWQILMLGGKRVGYASTTIRHATEDGRELKQVDGQTVLRVQRFRQTTDQKIRFTDLQAADGSLLRLRATIEQEANR